jgi:hypothetical protein
MGMNLRPSVKDLLYLSGYGDEILAPPIVIGHMEIV